MTSFKKGDCVMLKNGYSPKMNVSEVDTNPITQSIEIKCTWYFQGKMEVQTFDAGILKPCDTSSQLTKEGLDELIPPRR